MSKKVRATEGNAAGRDLESAVSVDLRLGDGVTIDQRVTIGALYTGPVHIHLVIDRSAPEPEEK